MMNDQSSSHDDPQWLDEFEDLANRVWIQLRAEFPAGVTPVAIVIMNRHLRHRRRLRPERA